MNPQSDSPVITLKLTQEQADWLDNAARFIQSELGGEVSHSSIMMRLMELGLPQFEAEMQGLRARANASRKRFPKLQLVVNKKSVT